MIIKKNSQNLGDMGDDNLFIGGESDSDIKLNRRLISDYKDEDAKLLPDVQKTKWILANNPIKAMKLYFESLNFQNMAKFYEMKNIGGLKQYRIFKKRFSVKVAEKIKKTRKIFVKQVEIREHLTRK